MDYLGKEYTLVKNDNFDGFLKYSGVPDEKIAILTSFNPTQKMVKNGDSFTITNSAPGGSRDTTFTPGVEFDETIGLDSVVKSTYTVDGNTVTQVVRSDKGTATFKKVYSGNELVVTITSDNWDGVAHRYYKA